MGYEGTRVCLGVAQIVGWLGAVAGVIAFVSTPGLALACVTAALVNHAFCGVGLAVLDVAERYLASTSMPDPLPLSRASGPVVPPLPAAPVPLIPARAEDLLEPGALKAPSPERSHIAQGRMFAAGPGAAPKILTEDDLGRLEEAERQRGRP